MSISIVIPTFKDDESLEKLLKTLEPMPLDEIIIADAESRKTLPPSLQFIPLKHIRSGKGRGPQIAAGVNAATHPLIWILHADSLPPKRGLETIKSEFQDRNLSLLTFTLAFDKHSFWLSLFAWFARLESALSTFGDQGFAFRKSDFEHLNIDLKAYPLMEDVALRRALKKRGKIKRAPLKITTSARRFAKYGVFKTQRLNLSLLIRYFCGTSPTKLYETYYSASASQK